MKSSYAARSDGASAGTIQQQKEKNSSMHKNAEVTHIHLYSSNQRHFHHVSALVSSILFYASRTLIDKK